MYALKSLFNRNKKVLLRQRAFVQEPVDALAPPGSPAADPPIQGGAANPKPAADRPLSLPEYLSKHGNPDRLIRKAARLLAMPTVLLEIGCGDGEAALAVARRNPKIGVLATDRYDCGDTCDLGSGYRQTALRWQAGTLRAQRSCPVNLVLLRAEADLLACLPDGSLDTILMVNPEPSVGCSVLDLLHTRNLIAKVRPGSNRLVVLPYSRELGVTACGGYEFEHDPDWSRGLGFLKASAFDFHRSTPVHWGVDLRRLSAYSGNSTQQDVYAFGQNPSKGGTRTRVPVHRLLFNRIHAYFTAKPCSRKH